MLRDDTITVRLMQAKTPPQHKVSQAATSVKRMLYYPAG